MATSSLSLQGGGKTSLSPRSPFAIAVPWLPFAHCRQAEQNDVVRNWFKLISLPILLVYYLVKASNYPYMHKMY